MSWEEFWVVLVVCALTMLACRVLPLFLLKGRELPPMLSRALGFIPPAAFAALVANDLLTPGMFAGGLWPAAIPLVAALCVVLVACKTRSLLWSAVAGVVSYALLTLI
ncbi:AzlD domain-containing protein [Enterorhabdus sp. P55]|uniref:AzlD domain-containing protein n=1 Tax=Enterorhabdus sp. P55 TaxID=2304571 RepID=UPI0013703B4A|nr:AzlD domain-containing protein [Enterorhabdus sp. P55]NBI32980.1 AzlD domain-containing protein [Enterorhabdus sp. P55]